MPPRFQDVANFDKGEDVVMKIPFTGNPKPTMKWVRDGEEIKASSKYKIERGDRHAFLTIRGADKEDDGPYRLTLENDLGTDSAVVKIQINGQLCDLFRMCYATLHNYDFICWHHILCTASKIEFP